MDVGNIGVLVEAGKAADLEILTDRHNLLRQSLFNSEVTAGILAGLESLNIGGIVIQNNFADVLDKCLEQFALGTEVRLAVDFNNGAGSALGADMGISHAFSSNAAGFLGSLCKALFTQPVNSLVHIAVACLESLLAVHHADIGHFSECFYILSSKCHDCFLLLIIQLQLRLLLPQELLQQLRQQNQRQHLHPGGLPGRHLPS